MSTTEEWIGVEQVAAEMHYTKRQAWEFLRKIGMLSCNTRSMDLARFTRAEFDEARDRALAPIVPRARTGAVPAAAREAAASKGRGATPASASASKTAKLRGA